MTNLYRRIVRRWVVGLAAAALVVLAAPTLDGLAAEDLPTAAPESVGMSSERLQRIDEYFQRFVDEGKIAGAVSLVARHGKVVHHSAVGMNHLEVETPMSTDQIFVLMSMTKPIVSTALMMLFEEGRFRLDDPVSYTHLTLPTIYSV